MGKIQTYQNYIKANKDQIVEDLIQLVKCQSPTTNVAYTEKCTEALIRLFRERLGVEPEQVFTQETRAPHLFYRIGTGRPKVLFMAHYDTVWNVDALPLVCEGNKIAGPGTFDTKYGTVSGIWALKALIDNDDLDFSVGFFLNSDEETGSRTSRPCYEPIAKQFENVFILEPCSDDVLKVGRKGVGNYTIEVNGIAAHAGNDFLKGRSAILEAARLTEKLFAMTDLERGSSVNVGIISGGTKVNVVAAHATLQVDLRVSTTAEAERLNNAIYSLQPSMDGVTLQITGGMNRPPFEENPHSIALFEKARDLAASIGVNRVAAVAGGGSDGNFTASWGIPTLDGLGGYGDGAHATWEHILIDESLDATSILAALTESV